MVHLEKARPAWTRSVWTVARWSVGLILLLGFILIPFLLWEAPLSRLAQGLSTLPGWAVAGATVGLLCVDVVAPIPSSAVALAAGALLGPFAGTAAAWVGLTLGCALGYELGARGGSPAARAVLGEVQFARLEAAMARRATATIALTRAVPVMAEGAILVAGAARAPRTRVLAAAALANLGYAGAMAGAGAVAGRSLDLFWIAFAAAIFVPLIAWSLLKILRRRSAA